MSKNSDLPWKKRLTLQQRTKIVVPRVLYQRGLFTMIKFETSLRMNFVLLANAYKPFVINDTRNVVLFGMLGTRMVAFRFFLENTSLNAGLLCYAKFNKNFLYKTLNSSFFCAGGVFRIHKSLKSINETLPTIFICITMR